MVETRQETAQTKDLLFLSKWLLRPLLVGRILIVA